MLYGCKRGGILDGSSPPIDIATLKIFSLDTQALVWNQLRDSTLDRAQKCVYAYIGHFSIYALGSVTSAVGEISQAFVYPNPYKPGSAGQFGSPALGDGIVFESMPAGSVVKIFTLSGHEVISLSDSDEDGCVFWNTKAQDGSKVSSGVYIYMISSSSGKKKGKLAIIR